jgi:hypothetical protein
MTKFASMLFLLLLFLCAGASAAPVVTATHLLTSSTAGYSNDAAGMATDVAVFDNRSAQSFTATVGGTLTEVAFFATKISSTTADLRVSIATLIGTQPGAVLGSRLLGVNTFVSEPFSGRPNVFNSFADFSSQNIQLSANSMYVIIFSSDTTEANYRIYGDNTGYTGGTGMFSQNGRPYTATAGTDREFRITVEAVPEPSTFALILIGAAGCVVRARRNRIVSRLLAPRCWGQVVLATMGTPSIASVALVAVALAIAMIEAGFKTTMPMRGCAVRWGSECTGIPSGLSAG